MEDYLKTLDMSELITYLEIEKQPGNFKKVEKILVSREKKMANLKENLEIYTGKCSELTAAVEEERNKNVGVEGKCSELMAALEVERKKNVWLEVKIADFEKLKMISNKHGEKVKQLEDECRIAGEREKAAVQDAATLLDEFDKVSKKRLREVGELKAKNDVLECGIRKAVDEFGELKAKKELLECGIRKAGDEIEAQKRRCVELEKMVEHVNELERDLEMHKRYKGVSEELEQKVVRLENERNIISGKEKGAREKIISLLGGVEKERSEKERIVNLMDDLEKVNRKRNEELLELKGKNQELEYAKQKAEDEIAAQKKVRMELEKTMQITMKRVNELEEDLGIHKRYKTVCSELEEKIARLERDCKNVSAIEKNAKERVTNLLGDLEKEKSAKERITYLLGDLEKLNLQLMTMNKGLDCAKRKADGEVEAQKKRYEELEKTVQQKVKHTNDLEKELEMYKARCSEFSEKASNKRDEKVTNLNIKIKDLESAKQKADDEIEAQKERYRELEKTVKNINDLEKDLEVYKAKCSELLVVVEEKKISLDEEAMLKKFNKYKAFCDEFREKVACLDDCKIVPERKKSAKKRTSNVSGIIQVINGDKNDELNELKRYNKDLDCVKPKDGSKDRKKRHKRSETQVSQLNDETSSLVCEPQAENANLELGNGVSNKEGGKGESKQGKVQSETNGGMNGTTCAAKLKIRLKPLNCICEGRVCDSAGAGSSCHSAVKASGTGHIQVPTVKRKRKRKSLNSDGGVDGDHIRRDKLKKDASGNQIPVVSHDGEQSLDPPIHHTNSPRKYEKKDVGAEKTPLKTSEPSSHTNSPRKYVKKDAGVEKTPLKTSETSSHDTNSTRKYEKKDAGAEKTLSKTSEPSSHDTTSIRKYEKKDAGAEKTPLKNSEPSSHDTTSTRKYEKKDAGAEKTPLKNSEPSSHDTNSTRKYEKKDAGAEKTPLKTSEPSSHDTNSTRKYEKKVAGAEKTPSKTSEPSRHDTNSTRKYEKKDVGAEKTPSKTSEPSETSVEKSANSISENDKEKPKTTEGKSRRIVHPPNRLNL